MPRSHTGRFLPSDDRFLRRLEGSLRPAEQWRTYRRGARHAAVNIILVHRTGAWHIPFVLRRPDLQSHPGQVGLPGGRVEPGETAIAAALRETEEEVGVPAAGLRVLGVAGDLYTSVSNFHVAAFVTALAEPPADFVWDEGELVGVVEVPLEHLLDHGAWTLEGPHPGPQLVLPGAVIWGLTAGILRGSVLPLLRAARESPVRSEPAP